MTDHEKRIRERIYGDDSLYTNVRNSDLRALLADLDGMRGALRTLKTAVNYKAACLVSGETVKKVAFADDQVWKAVDEAEAALKGASHD